MAKVHRSGSQKSDAESTSKDEKQQQQEQSPDSSTTPATSNSSKGKQSGNFRKSSIGGTAIQGAKSTQPKEIPTGAAANQKPEYYNRETRRRMQQMGTGPYNERTRLDPRARQKKRLEKNREKVKQLVDAKGPNRDIKLGKRNTYCVIALVVLIIIGTAIAIIIRHPF
ncbi:MAG: hypothetical protein ACRDHZ_05035 [Ktedonobacteraceae bacterium]